MRFRQLAIMAVPLLLTGLARAQDVASGPEAGTRVPELKVHDLTGANKDKEVDYAAERKDKPTVYFFVNAAKFDRPMNRFLKTLDEAITKDFSDVAMIGVWLTEDVDKTKEFLPRVQQSVKYEASTLTVYTGEKGGPKGWNVNSDAHLTVIVATKGKVTNTFGYQSINETDVPKVKEAIAKAAKAK